MPSNDFSIGGAPASQVGGGFQIQNPAIDKAGENKSVSTLTNLRDVSKAPLSLDGPPAPLRSASAGDLRAVTAELGSCSMKDLLALVSELYAKNTENKAVMNRSQVQATVGIANATKSQAGDIKSAAWKQLLATSVGAMVQVGVSLHAMKGAANSMKSINEATAIKNALPATATKAEVKAANATHRAAVKDADAAMQASQTKGQMAGAMGSVVQSGLGVWVASSQADQKIHEAQGQAIQAEKDASQSAAQDLDKSLASFLGLMAAVTNLQSSQAQSFRA